MGHWVQVQTLVFQTKDIPCTNSGVSNSPFLKTALIPVDVIGYIMQCILIISFLLFFCPTLAQIPCNTWLSKPVTKSDTLAFIENKINKVLITEILWEDSLNERKAGYFTVTLENDLVSTETNFSVSCEKIINETIKKDTIVQTIDITVKGDKNKYYCVLTHLLDTNGFIYKTVCKYSDKIFLPQEREIKYYYENKLLIKAEYYAVLNPDNKYWYYKLVYKYSR